MSSETCWAVVPAGGSGSRFSSHQDKLLAPLAGKPVLCRTIEALLSCPLIKGVVIVGSARALSGYQTLLTKAFPDAPLVFTLGGATRRESVYQGLLALPSTVGMVAVHDAARPLIEPLLIQQAIEAVQGEVKGSILALPVVDTIKQAASAAPQISHTMDRSLLWRAQTPQVFELKTLLAAHQQVSLGIEVTDDAQLLELAGLGPVQLVPGSESNLKITNAADILLAEAFLNRQSGASASLL